LPHCINSVEFSVDGRRIVTASDDKTARLWDAENGRLLKSFNHPTAVMSASFSGDGARIITSCNDTSARIWSALTGTLIRTLTGEPRWNDVADSSARADSGQVYS
jgi:WD40 repeat protein